MDNQQIQLNRSPRVVAVGMVTLDYLYVLASYPDEGATIESTEHKVIAGGPIGRGAITAGRLGATVDLLGMCGNDVHAEVLRDQLGREPVTAALFESRQPSQHSFVLAAASSASRTIIWTAQPRADDRLLAALPAALRGADAALMDCTDPALARSSLEICHRLGIPTIIDTGSYRESSDAYLADADYIIAPEKYFAARHPSETLETAMRKVHDDFGPTVLAATRGDRGGLYLDEFGYHSYRAVPVAAQDSSGAGDTFHGAFAWAIAAGASVDMAIRVAAWAAAQKCRGVGNSTLPNGESLAAFLANLGESSGLA